MLEQRDKHPIWLVQRTFKDLNWTPRGKSCGSETHGFIPIEISIGELTSLIAEGEYSLDFFGASPKTTLHAIRDRDRKLVMHDGHVLMVETLPKADPNLLWICDDSFRRFNDIITRNTNR